MIDSRGLSRYSSRRVLQGLLFGKFDVVKGGFLELDAISWDTGEVDTLEFELLWTPFQIVAGLSGLSPVRVLSILLRINAPCKPAGRYCLGEF